VHVDPRDAGQAQLPRLPVRRSAFRPSIRPEGELQQDGWQRHGLGLPDDGAPVPLAIRRLAAAISRRAVRVRARATTAPGLVPRAGADSVRIATARPSPVTG